MNICIAMLKTNALLTGTSAKVSKKKSLQKSESERVINSMCSGRQCQNKGQHRQLGVVMDWAMAEHIREWKIARKAI